MEEESQETLDGDADVDAEEAETQPASYVEDEEERQGSPDWEEPTGEDDEDVEMANGVGAISSLDSRA